jgi:UDP:flavonoid glycosyltransferase YjiC (YdhE family)
MKVGLQAWGTEGDIRPFIGLAGGLSANGHDVTLVLTSLDLKDYSSYGRAGGFRIIDAQDTYRQWGLDRLISIKERLMALPPLEQLTSMLEEVFEPAVDEMYEAARQLCRASDVLIGHYFAYPVQLAAWKEGCPYGVFGLNADLYPSRHRPPSPFPNLGVWMNPWLWKLAGGITNRLMLKVVNRLCSREGHPVKDVFSELWQSKRLTLIPWSPLLCPRPADWGGHLQICGFFVPPGDPEGWTMPADLRRFMSQGHPPVFMTFGSITPAGMREADDLFVEAVRMAGCRAIVQSIGNRMSGPANDPNLYRVGFVPYQELLSECALVVHHGGAGTTHCAVLAGCPSVVVEHFGDQSFWGAQLRRAGLGSRVLHRRSVTAKSLAAEMGKALSSPAMKRRAEAAGESMRQENGVKRAVELIEERMAD